jgi:hypothetical protein
VLRFGDSSERVTPEELVLPGVDLSVRNDNAAAEPAEPPPAEQEKKKKGSGASAARGSRWTPRASR